jgi:hypothetical protein
MAGMQTRPDPDPTVLTTAALLREVANLEKGLDSRIQGVEKAIDVAHQDLVRVPTAVDKAVETLRQLVWAHFATVDVKFGGIDTQFKERDTRVEQSAKAGSEALNAALQAAKEAVSVQQQSNLLMINKSETTTKEQINALVVLLQQNTNTTDVKIESLKERIDKMDGTRLGRGDMFGWIIAAVSLLATGIMGAYYMSHFAK